MIRLTPPTIEKYVSSAWGASRAYRGGTHEGLDFPSKEGSPVVASAPGVVAYVDNLDNSFAGRWIALHHGKGIHTLYMHNRENQVQKGQQVARGQQIGTVGATGTKSSRPHVHFGTRMLDSALTEYATRYNVPSTGFGKKFTHGHSVPSETFMDQVKYNPKAETIAKSKGVVFYRGFPVGKIMITAGLAFLAFKYVFK